MSKIYEGNSFVVTGGSSSGFLKADGTVDTTTYATGASSFSGSYNDLTDKPTIPPHTTRLPSGQRFISDYTVTQSDVTSHQAALTITESQISDLSHFSGSYNDLTDKPSLAPSNAEQNVQSDWNATSGDAFIQNKPSLFDGAYSSLSGKPTLFDGAYSSLTGAPSIPTATSDLTNDSNFSTFDGAYSSLTGKPTLFDGAYSSLTGKPTLFDGAYGSLTGAPSIPTATSDLTNDSNFSTFSGSYNDLTNKPSLFDGAYSSLSGTPTIPGDIEDLGNVASGASGSDLLSYNSAGFGTWEPKSLSELGIASTSAVFSGDYDDLTNKPTIPKVTSDLTNDSGFLTSLSGAVTTTGTQTVAGDKTFSGNTSFGGIVSNIASDRGWQFDDSSTTRQTLKINADAFRLYFDGSGGQHETFYVSQTGEVRFRVDGSSKHLFQTDGDAHHDGDVIAYTTTISDRRKKDEIETIENATETVNKLRGVSYVWNSGHRKGQKEIGVIAQEVEEVLPFLVREKSDFNGDKIKTVDYDKLIGLLIEDSKSKDIRIKQLEEKVNKLSK
jgi:hypothetical protein